MLSCNCLNVIIEAETKDLDLLNLTEDERKDIFFKQDLLQVVQLKKIEISHWELINSYNIGSWMVHNCFNCGMHTHAIHRDRNSAHVLVCGKLLTSRAITTLRNSDQFSPIFNIVINYNPLDHNNLTWECISPEVKQIVGKLKQVANEIIKQETDLVDDRIRTYVENQYAALEEFRDKVLKEQTALARVVINEKLKSVTTSEMTSTNINTSALQSMSNTNKNAAVPETVMNKSAVIKPKPFSVSKTEERSKNINIRNNNIKQTSSFDAEGLFSLEDMDDSKYSQSESDDTDNEESVKEEGGIVISGGRSTNQINVAKSLPMNIPTFMSPLHNHASDDSDDILSRNEDQLDIAASIKALAKSVHGDTVFGDLPRPGFSTNM